MTSELNLIPEPDHVADLGDGLQALMEQDLEVEQRLAISGAVLELYDVEPQYRRRFERRQFPGGVDLPQLLQNALDHAQTPAQILRIGLVAHELRPLTEPQ